MEPVGHLRSLAVALFVALLAGCGGSNPPDDAATPDVPTLDAREFTDTARVNDVPLDRGNDAVTVDTPAPFDAADVVAAPDVVDVPAAPDVPAPDAPASDVPAPDVGVDVPAPDVPATDVGVDVLAPDVPTCATGYADCDGNAANGCETDTTTSSSHCGACGRSCPAVVRATPVCVTGACDFRCLPGYDDCNGNAGDGCEISLSSTANCGTCGATCARANATATCAAGACALGACATGFGNCDGNDANGCELALTTTTNCGACGVACAGASNGAAQCASGHCGVLCNAGYVNVGSACVVQAAPRPLAPMSLGDVSQRRPTLRWVLPSGYDGAAVELCRDRACTAVIETLTVAGSSARPSADLPANGVVFWRMRGRVGSATDTAYSPTWLFHVPAISASTAVDTSSRPHFDVNGDGYDDLVVGSFYASPGGRVRAGTASVFHGSASGIGATAARVLEGGAAGDYFGISVASAGDVDGDGYGDLIVGAYYASPGGRTNAGAASVFLGSATGIGATAARVLEGGAARDYFGISVGGAGDVNGDGYADVVAGAYGAAPGGRVQAGTASVFLGSATGIGATAVRVLEGGAAGDYFGYSVADAGDVNGDGNSDLVVGAILASPGGSVNAGTASVFLGSASGISATAARVLQGAAYDQFGHALASAGDLNGDGYTDLVVGAIVNLGGRPGAGTASVFLGSASGIGATAARVLAGDTVNERLGSSVAGAGDVNGDGYADLVVGASGDSPGGRVQAGTARVYLGSTSGIGATAASVLEGGAAGDRFGYSAASVGDLNRDGYADLVVGTYGASPGGRANAGTASVFLGRASGISPTASNVLEGGAADDYFSISVASVGDVNGTLAPLRASSPGSASTPPRPSDLASRSPRAGVRAREQRSVCEVLPTPKPARAVVIGGVFRGPDALPQT
ncbi:MAG: putative integrin-like protein [Myxococcaceae bacterium]|nr:putative integrin-like protein [Myxococcaceae bacterium]